MTDGIDPLESRDPAARERDLFGRLPAFLTEAVATAPGLARWLGGHAAADVRDHTALAKLPVLHKSELMEFQQAEPPFGGFADVAGLKGNRVFLSPGPIWEPEATQEQAKDTARAFRAIGIKAGDIVHNAFSYHMTPGGFFLDAGARALGCTVFPAGTGSTDMQVEAAAALKPTVYCGTPDFLKVMLDRADELGKDLSSFRIGLVSGGALFPSLRADYAARGVKVFQCYATAEFGVIAYESAAADGTPNPGLIVNENLIVEIVRPGTGDPVAEGDVGEVVVTGFNSHYPLVRLGTGDLSAVLAGASPCGRTNTRIKGWMGRADQRTKIKGMFVDPKQVAEIVRRHPGIGKARLVVSRDGDRDRMVLRVEPAHGGDVDAGAIGSSLRDATKLGGAVEIVASGTLPNDGKVIADERDYAR